ncbi:heparinase II/III domain-containing protein [Fervidibacillus albus]|uniref:Heparinase II/III-family protein n=1 Tax=Fervidibacillus albus TaxID=2980026 RepID=A0A9E8LT71_9BACI|nr:heparinase II/III family protein [Fervidibacillus albus]WAA08945.1 heparinase II/III-family protein [Fervidibacillus albus]
MEYFSDLQLTKKLSQPGEIYFPMIEQMDKEVTQFARHFKDDYRKMSEWGHHYFCKEDGGQLVFDLSSPHSHRCAICGKAYKGKKLDNVWIYFYRNTAFVTILKCAVLYRIKEDKKYLQFIKKILSFYVDHYDQFVIHSKDKVIDDLTYDVGGAGKIMPQALNEAIMIVRMINALEMVKDEIGKEFLDNVNNKMFLPASKLLKAQLVRIHNIPCWANSALGMIGLFTKNDELLNEVFSGEFGIRNQLKQGVSEDGFWYEGSIHYNFFLLEGVINLLLFTKIYHYDFGEEENIIKKMLTVAYEYAFDNGTLPNPNDGWPDVNLKTYSYIYHTATKIFGEHSEIGNLLKNIESGTEERGIIPLSSPYYYRNDIPLERFIFNPDMDFSDLKTVKRTSVNYPASYYGILRNNKINIFCKYGHRGPSHAHPDKMNIEVMIGNSILTRDLSNAGYGSRLCNEWHRMSASHNTVVVNGENHVSTKGGSILEFTHTTLHAISKNVYEGIDFTRKIELSPFGFSDEFNVNASDDHTFDWFFHSQAKLISELPYEMDDLGYSTNGYQHIKDVKKIVTNGDTIVLKWILDDWMIHSEIDIRNKKIYIAKTYDNPASRLRTSIILREKNSNCSFKVKWEFIPMKKESTLLKTI